MRALPGRQTPATIRTNQRRSSLAKDTVVNEETQ
jgi:hypothetical protein